MLIRDATDIIAMHGMDDADMLTIVAAVAVGMLVAGIPLSRRIARYERPKPTPFPDVSDLGETIIAEWPDDRAAAMLEAWRTERARRDLRAMRQAADVEFGQAAQAVTKRGAFLPSARRCTAAGPFSEQLLRFLWFAAAARVRSGFGGVKWDQGIIMEI